MKNYNTNCGIYKITDVKNGKSYIGQSVNVKSRISSHKSDLKNNRHINSYLQRSYNLRKKFAFEILEMCDFENLDEKEVFWIDFFDTTDREFGYNFESGGNKLKRHHKETIAKMSIVARGSNSKLSIDEVKLIKTSLSEGASRTDLAIEYGVHISTVSKIATCKNWEWVLPELNDVIMGYDTNAAENRSVEIESHYEEGMSATKLSALSGYTTAVVSKFLVGKSEEYMNNRYDKIRMDYASGEGKKDIMVKYDISASVFESAVPNAHDEELRLRNDRIRELHKSGHSNNDISKVVGIHRTTVTDVLLGRTKDKKMQRVKRTKETENLVVKLISDGISKRQTAIKVGISRCLVDTILKEQRVTQ